MADAGYEVVNKIHCHAPLDIAVFAELRAAFATHFGKLSPGNTTATMREFATATKKHGGHS
jgi:hypothetical protein